VASIPLLPGLLTLVRIPLAVSFPFLPGPYVRAAAVAVAWTTDVADGVVARRRGEMTRAGAILDGVADHTFALFVFGTFLFEGALSAGQLAIVLSRDLFTTLSYLVIQAARLQVPLKARRTGKLVTGLQHLLVPIVLFAPGAVRGVVLLLAVASLGAIVDYSLAARRALRSGRLVAR
jgi:phosphatidylglycerophosphate synthase